MGLFAPIRVYVETLVHPSAQQDALRAARHRAFIAPRLLGSVVALAAFPIYLFARGAPGTIGLFVLAWLTAPILIALYLSRTGRYESAHVFSALALTVLVTVVAAATGGIGSAAAVWLVLVPVEASLSASRRVIAAATASALAAAALLIVLGAAHRLPPSAAGAHDVLAAVAVVSAVLYAAGLAVGAEVLARRTFQLLHAEEDRYRLLAGNMTDVILRYGRDGAVLFASPAAESVFGVPVAALHGHGLFDRVHVADRPVYLTALGDAAALGEGRAAEFRVRRERRGCDAVPRAEFLWIEMRCQPLDQPIPAAAPQQRGEVVAVLRDVSERMRQQQALEDARAEAERANARKSRFLATMSHELRTPLNAVIGFSEMLMKEEALPLDAERRGEYAALINESGRQLLAVVNGILDVSKIETDRFSITFEPFAPAQVIARCCELVSLQAREAGIAIEMAATDMMPEMIADKRALNQILLNLLSNAIRFSERGGKVVVGARVDAATIAITVEDNGIGISDEDLARVGEPYFQAQACYERRRGGTGLGLSIVSGLVRLHGGELSIRSRLGEGTRVTVRLPLDCERAQASPRSYAERAPGTIAAIHRSAPAAAHAAARPHNSLSAREALPPRADIVVKKRA